MLIITIYVVYNYKVSLMLEISGAPFVILGCAVAAMRGNDSGLNHHLPP